MFLLLALPLALAADGWWDPATDVWSKDAVVDSFKKVKEQVAPSDFLGDTSGMKPYSKAEWAWFVTGFSPDAYKSVAVAPARNSMGRYHVTGQDLLQKTQITYLQGVSKSWKKKVVAGTDADLVVYTNIRFFNTTANGVEYVVESLGVDKANNVVFKLQYLVGTNGTAGMVVGAATNGVSGLVSAIPNDKDQFGFITASTYEGGGDIRAIVEDAGRDFAKGKVTPPSGAASPLHVDRAALVDAQKERFGPALQTQVAEMLAFIGTPTNEPRERADRLRDLGKIGATGAILLSEKVIGDKDEKNGVQENAAWALGEIGHPDALDTLGTAKGVNGFAVKSAIIKIETY